VAGFGRFVQNICSGKIEKKGMFGVVEDGNSGAPRALSPRDAEGDLSD
jgi:hypothetical protein